MLTLPAVPQRALGMMTLPSQPLPYRGVLLDMTTISEDEAVNEDEFESQLGASLEQWATEGVKSCMLKLEIRHAALASIAARQGFTFHHVPLDAGGQHVVLKAWLQPSLSDKVPPFATHQVGVAGLCIDDRGRLLVVKEWRDDAASGTRVPSAQWKLPGGLLDCGESFGDAAMRETWEETGVRTRFRSLLCFWHRHGLPWGKSDLYYVARLEPSTASSTISLDPEEISDCCWMPVSEFLEKEDHPLITAVLRRCYGIDSPAAAVDGAQLPPLVELTEEGVQWPNREPYPTYFGTMGGEQSRQGRASSESDD